VDNIAVTQMEIAALGLFFSASVWQAATEWEMEKKRKRQGKTLE
jgi:hypothetical protein